MGKRIKYDDDVALDAASAGPQGVAATRKRRFKKVTKWQGGQRGTQYARDTRGQTLVHHAPPRHERRFNASTAGQRARRKAERQADGE